MSGARNKFTPAYIESGIVVNVDSERFSVDVSSQYSNRRYLAIPIMAPYLHPHAGEGIYALPEVGTPAWVCQPSETGARPFLLGFGGIWDAKKSYRASRPAMNHGDIFLGTRDRNYVFLRRGGVVQVQATPLAQRMYLPLGNLIRDLCEGYQMRNFAGEFIWEADRDDDTTTGDRPTRMKMFVRELADDKYPIAQVTLGDHDQTEKALSIEIFDKGGDGRSVQASLFIKKNGDVLWDVEGKWSAEVKGDYSVVSEEGDLSFKASQGTGLVDVKKDLTLKAGTVVKVRAPKLQVGAGGQALEVVTGASPSVKLAGGGSQLVKGDVLLQALIPLLSALSTLTPTVPSTSAVASTAVAAMQQLPDLLSKKSSTG